MIHLTDVERTKAEYTKEKAELSGRQMSVRLEKKKTKEGTLKEGCRGKRACGL